MAKGNVYVFLNSPEPSHSSHPPEFFRSGTAAAFSLPYHLPLILAIGKSYIRKRSSEISLYERRLCWGKHIARRGMESMNGCLYSSR
jgi:hypothetical protein